MTRKAPAQAHDSAACEQLLECDRGAGRAGGARRRGLHLRVGASTFAPGARYVSPPVASRAQGCSSALGMGRQEFPGPQFAEKGRVGPGGRV